MADELTPEEMIKIDTTPPGKSWMDVPPDFSPGKFPYPAQPKSLPEQLFPPPEQWPNPCPIPQGNLTGQPTRAEGLAARSRLPRVGK